MNHLQLHRLVFAVSLVLLSTLCVTSNARTTCYGDISKLHPKGQRIIGVTGSNLSAAQDLSDLRRYGSYYVAAAQRYCLQVSVIAAIASRESRGGRILYKTNGYGDGGRGYGLMQCDIYSSGLPCRSCAWNSTCHVAMMVGKKLVPYIEQVAAKFPAWAPEQHIQGGVAAYNFGVKNVRSWARLDVGTTHNDYSNDVIARAQYLMSHGWHV